MFNSKKSFSPKAMFTAGKRRAVDERVKEMRTMYEGYAKNLTEVVKAASAGGANVNTSVVTK